MPIELIPDAETVSIKLLMDDVDIAPLISTNVASTLPANPPFPFVVVQLIATTPVGGEANVNEYWMQIDSYASRNDFATASLLARTIFAVITQKKHIIITPPGGETSLFYGGKARNFRRVPEPKTKWARYGMDALMTMRIGS